MVQDAGGGRVVSRGGAPGVGGPGRVVGVGESRAPSSGLRRGDIRGETSLGPGDQVAGRGLHRGEGLIETPASFQEALHDEVGVGLDADVASLGWEAGDAALDAVQRQLLQEVSGQDLDGRPTIRRLKVATVREETVG